MENNQHRPPPPPPPPPEKPPQRPPKRRRRHSRFLLVLAVLLLLAAIVLILLYLMPEYGFDPFGTGRGQQPVGSGGISDVSLLPNLPPTAEPDAGALVIRVEGEQIRVNDTPVDSIDALRELLEERYTDDSACRLVDAHAVQQTYQRTKELLEDLAIPFTEEQES